MAWNSKAWGTREVRAGWLGVTNEVECDVKSVHVGWAKKTKKEGLAAAVFHLLVEHHVIPKLDQ